MAKNTLHLEKKPKYYQKILTENSSLYTWGRVYGLGKIPSGKSLSFCASIFTPATQQGDGNKLPPKLACFPFGSIPLFSVFRRYTV